MYAVFKYDESNMYRPDTAVKVYQRKAAAEKYADKLNATDPEAHTFRGYVVREYRRKACKRDVWFAAVMAVDPWFARKSENELVLWFSGYKTADCYEAEAALRELGGFVLDMKFDKVCGKTAVIVREPYLLDGGAA